eukprot:14354441-Alexandrium_andersonii.AAC.1
MPSRVVWRSVTRCVAMRRIASVSLVVEGGASAVVWRSMAGQGAMGERWKMGRPRCSGNESGGA